MIFVYFMPKGLCDWPEGTYGIPAHKDGCPRSDHLYRWKLGMQVPSIQTHRFQLRYFFFMFCFTWAIALEKFCIYN